MIFMKQILLLSLLAVDLFAQTPPVQSKYQLEYFNYQEVMIPMRDGVRLQTVLRADAEEERQRAATKFPLHENSIREFPKTLIHWTESGLIDDLIADGYIFVKRRTSGAAFKPEEHVRDAASAPRQE